MFVFTGEATEARPSEATGVGGGRIATQTLACHSLLKEAGGSRVKGWVGSRVVCTGTGALGHRQEARWRGCGGGLAWAVGTRHERGFVLAELGWTWDWTQLPPMT